MQVTGAVSGILLVAASTGGMTASALTRYMFDTFSYMWVVYLCFIACMAHVITFIVSEVIVKCSKVTDTYSLNNTTEMNDKEPLQEMNATTFPEET